MAEINQMSYLGAEDNTLRNRKIIGAYPPGRAKCGWTVGVMADSIELYAESGEMAMVPYLCIKLNDGREIRTAARHYDVVFAPVEDNSADEEDIARENDFGDIGIQDRF